MSPRRPRTQPERARTASGEISADDAVAEVIHERVDSAVIAGMQAEWLAMRPAIEACEEERQRRHRWRHWRRLAQGVGVTGVVSALAVATKLLLSVGSESEAARVQREMVRDTAARVRKLEAESAAAQAILMYLRDRARDPYQE